MPQQAWPRQYLHELGLSNSLISLLGIKQSAIMALIRHLHGASNAIVVALLTQELPVLHWKACDIQGCVGTLAARTYILLYGMPAYTLCIHTSNSVNCERSKACLPNCGHWHDCRCMCSMVYAVYVCKARCHDIACRNMMCHVHSQALVL